MGVCISSDSGQKRRVFPFTEVDATEIGNLNRLGGDNEDAFVEGNESRKDTSQRSIHTFVPLLTRQTNTQYLIDRSTKLAPVLKQYSYLILLYFDHEDQISVILALLGALLNMHSAIDTASNASWTGTPSENLSSGGKGKYLGEVLTMLACNPHSMIIHIEQPSVLLQFYNLFFKYLNITDIPVSWRNIRSHNTPGPPLSKISLDKIRILNTKLPEDQEATTEFLVKQSQWQNTVEDEILFDKDMDEEVQLLEKQLHVQYDLTMSDFFSIALTTYHPSPKHTHPSNDLSTFVHLEHTTETPSQKCTILTVELSQHLFSVNTTQILRILKQYGGEVLSLEASAQDVDKVQVVVLWMHHSTPPCDILDNLLENNPYISENNAEGVNKSSALSCEYAVKSAFNILQLCRAQVQEPHVRLFITTNSVRRRFILDPSERTRVLTAHGDALDVSHQCLQSQHSGTDPLPLFFIDSKTLSKTHNLVISSPANVDASNLTWHQVQYVHPYTYRSISLVFHEMSASKISLLQRCIDSLPNNKLQTILLVGQEAPLNERIHLQDSIENYCVEQKMHCTHLFRCYATAHGDSAPFYYVKKFLQELLCSYAAYITRQCDSIDDITDLSFMEHNLSLILAPSEHKYLSVLNAPFDVNFPPSETTQFLYGDALEEIQNNLLKQVIHTCVDTLPHNIVVLLDSFENWDMRSKYIVNILHESLMDRSALLSVTLSGTRHWRTSADRVIETGKITSRTQFEKHLEVVLQDQLLGIDEQFIHFLLKQTNLNVNYARDLTQFLLHHQKLEVDENDILQFDPTLQFSTILTRLHSYSSFLQIKYSNMDSAVQTIVSSLSVLTEPFSFQLAIHVLRGLFHNCSTFLWSILMKLSTPIADGTVSHSTTFILDQDNLFHWMSDNHRAAALLLLDNKRTDELRLHAAQFLWNARQSHRDMQQAADLYLSQTFTATSEISGTPCCVDISVVSELIDTLERQHRILEASQFLRRKISALKADKRTQSITREIALGHLRLSSFLRQLYEDEGRFTPSISELKEGVLYSVSWPLLHHQYLFHLWYLCDKVHDFHASIMYANRLLELNLGDSSSSDSEIAFVYSGLCKSTILFRNEDCGAIVDTLVEPCLLAYGKRADDIHTSAVKRYGFVDPIVPILCIASSSAWLTSRDEKATRYFEMAQHIMHSHRIVHQRFITEIYALYWLPACFWTQNRTEILRTTRELRSFRSVASPDGSSPQKQSTKKQLTMEELYTVSIPILFEEFVRCVQGDPYDVNLSLPHISTAEQYIPSEFTVTLIHVHILIETGMIEEAESLLNRIMPPSTSSGLPSTPRSSLAGSEKKTRGGHRWSPLQTIFSFYKSECASDKSEKLALLRGVLESRYPLHFQVKAAVRLLDLPSHDKDDVEATKRIAESAHKAKLSGCTQILLRELQERLVSYVISHDAEKPN